LWVVSAFYYGLHANVFTFLFSISRKMDAFYEAHDDDNDDDIIRPKVKPSSSSSSSAISTVAVVGIKRKRDDIPPSSSSSSSNYSTADGVKRNEQLRRFTAQHNAAFSTAQRKHHDALFEAGYVDKYGNPILAKFKALIGLPYSIGVLFPKYWVLESDRDEFVAYLRWKHHQGAPFDYTSVVKKLANRLCSLSENGEPVVVLGVMNSSSSMSRMTQMIEAAVEIANTDQVSATISHVDAFTRQKTTEINPAVHKAYGRVPTTNVAALADQVVRVAGTLDLKLGALARLKAAGTVVVVDDIISTGGTLASYGQFLRKQTVDPKKLVFCGIFETNDRTQLSSFSLADIFKQISDSNNNNSSSSSSSSIESSSSSSVSSTKIGSCSPSQAKEILKKRNYSNKKDADNKIAEMLLQHLPTEVYDRVMSGTHPRSWGRIGSLSPYDNDNTANYIISIVFQSLGAARRCLEFCKNNRGHGVSSKLLEVFEAGIKKLNGLPVTTPFSFDYVGLESGGRYLTHWTGTLMFDRSMVELSSEKLGKHAAKVEMNLLVSTQQVQNIAVSRGVDSLTVRQVGESLFSNVFQTNSSNGGGNVGTTGVDLSFPSIVLSTGVKLLGMRLLSVLQIPQTPESTEDMKALVYAAVPGLHVSTGNVFLSDSIINLDLPRDTSSGVIHSILCSDSGDIVKELVQHSTNLDPELLSLTREAFLEDMSSRSSGDPSNNRAHMAAFARAKLWLNEKGLADSPSFAKDAAAAAMTAATSVGGAIVRQLCDKGSKLSDEIQTAASEGFDNAMRGLDEGQHATGRGKAGAFLAVRELQQAKGTANSPDAIAEATAAAVYASCVGGRNIGGPRVRQLCERGKVQSDEMKAEASAGYANGGGKAGAYISIRNYQATDGKAHEDDSIFEANAAANYAACSAGGKKGATLKEESEKEFNLLIKKKGGKGLKITGLL